MGTMRTENTFVLFGKYCGDNPTPPEIIARLPFSFLVSGFSFHPHLALKDMDTYVTQICPD